MTLAPASGTMYSRLLPWTGMDWPLDWPAVFGRRSPLRLELGFGNGEHLAARAAAEPSADWVGVEISWGSVRRALRRLQDQNLENARVLHGDGALLVRKLFPPDSLDRVVINHSDPWPKERHRERRLVQSGLIADLAVRMEMEGELQIATDHAGYAAWITDVLEGQNHLRSVHPTPWIDRGPGDSATKYMQRGIEAGSVIHSFVWKKIQKAPPRGVREERLEDMPNVLVEGEGTIAEALDGFEPVSWKIEHPGHVVFIQLARVYRQTNGREWLVEARVKEDGFEQHFAVSVAERHDRRIRIKPASLGAPRPTPGVKEAVKGLVRVLLGRGPGLRVVASSVGRSLGPGDPPAA